MKERVALAHAHYSHPSLLIGEWQPLGPAWPLLNEYLSGCAVTFVFAVTLYFLLSSLSYLALFVWGRRRFTPRGEELRYEPETYLHDLKWSFLNILGETPLVTLIKLGYPYFSKVQYGWAWHPLLPLYILLHVAYDEFFTYWFHRLLHHPRIYRGLHSIHHKSKAVTPFTGFAFHPLDAFIQAMPVFTSCYFLPIPIDLVLAHGLLTSLWAISIHDNVNLFPFKGILYAGSHSIHHFPWGENYNYGKFTSVCDRLYGTYCDPEGVTGYGYQPGPVVAALTTTINRWYTAAVPDHGQKKVGRVRELYAKKIA